MDAQTLGWLLLRVGFSWIFLYPLPKLINNWEDTVETTELLMPWKTSFFAAVGCFMMFVGSLGILFGVFPKISAIVLFCFSIAAAQIHFSLGKLAQTLAANDEQASTKLIADLAMDGHVTSAQKNYVIAAVCLFFIFVGTGPMSLYPIY